MSTLAITGVSLRRVLRDRTALFFMIVLPVMVILIIGATVRGFSTFRVGVVDLGAGRAGAQLTGAMASSHGLQIRHYGSVDAATTAVARGEVSTAVVLPARMDAALRQGRSVHIEVLAEPTNSTEQAAAAAVDSVISSDGSRVQAAAFAAGQGAGSYDANLSLAERLRGVIPQVRVNHHLVDSRSETLPEGFSYSAPTMLVLFVFLNALAGGAAIIETRRLGMYERMVAAPLRSSTVIAGEALGYLAIALLQAALIVGVGALLFGVSWGNPLAAIALVVAWAAVGAGAGMLSGTLFRTPEQAGAIGPAVGIALAMLGGCMWPLSMVSLTMRRIGHLTPQAWAVDAWTTLLSRGGTLVSIGPQLAVLVAFAAVFLALATLRLRAVLR